VRELGWIKGRTSVGAASVDDIFRKLYRTEKTEMMTLNKTLAALALVASVGATAPASAQIYLGSTKDQCLGQLYVERVNGDKLPINRGLFSDYNPRITSGSLGRCCGWRWWCNSSKEWSRLGGDHPKAGIIKVWHDPTSREIIWWGYRQD
jgi:hypothetical protein